jgi:hypothetical protein
MYMTFVPHRKPSYEPPRPVTEIALLPYMERMFVPHGKHSYNLHGLIRRETIKKREKWVVVRGTTGGGNRIYHHRF